MVAITVRALIGTLGLCALAVGAAAAQSDSDPGGRRFTVRDSIAMADFTEPGVVSPDGRWFITATQRGQLSQGVTEGTIWLFDVADVMRRNPKSSISPVPKPVVLARLTAAINGGGGDLGHGNTIMRPTWESNSHALLFLGRSGRENRQLFRVNVSDHALTALTPATQDVVHYSTAGEEVLYLAGPDVASDRVWWSNDPSAPDVVNGTGESLLDLLYPAFKTNARYMPSEFEVWRVRHGAAEPVVDAATGRPMRILGSYYVGAIGVSRDGSKMVVIAHADRIPVAWERYEVPKDLESEPFHAYPPTAAGSDVPLAVRKGDYTRGLQYQLVDLGSGTRRPLFGAPATDFLRGGVDESQIAWSPDGRFVAVTGTVLPLAKEAVTAAQTRPCGAAVSSVDGTEVECLIDHRSPKSGPVSKLMWNDSGSRLSIQLDGSPTVEYERTGGHWRMSGRHPTAAPALTLTVRQDLDVPPVLFARDSRTGQEVSVLDPNPQLKGIALGNVSMWSGKDPRGHVIHGQLAKPPDFVPGHRYPLVIQTHGIVRNRFFKTGFDSETANAGRVLAGRGILVLQVGEPHNETDGTWREATERGTDVYLAAIDQLAREGLVDSTKVGVSGYSSRGPFVLKALEEAPDRFAAAFVTNTEPGSMFGYFAFVDRRSPGDTKRMADFLAGAAPYGDGLQKWFDRAPGFLTDRIRAPVLISAADPDHLIALWSLYAPLRDQGKPVELQYIRNGQHNLTKPLEVFAHQEILVDWFDFWLNSHEDSSPEKAAQYARWRELRRKRLSTN
jgi:dipeptidyl aminopeptidase/acylaminoacyl peptidase